MAAASTKAFKPTGKFPVRQTVGPRAGQKFRVATGSKGNLSRLYRSGFRVKLTRQGKLPAPKLIAATKVRPAAAPAPRAPAPAPAPIGPQPLPPDPSYSAQLANIEQQRASSAAQFSAARQQNLIGYGYNEAPGGALNFDPNNPFSKAALLRDSYNKQRAAASQSWGSSGQAFSGAYQQAQDVSNRNQLEASDNLTQNLQSFLARNTMSQEGVASKATDARAGAYADALARVENNENPLYEAVAPVPAAKPRKPAKKPAAKKPAARKPAPKPAPKAKKPASKPAAKKPAPRPAAKKPAPKLAKGRR
jgi:hypothetical protein